jgi:hypothetical protein
MATDIVGSLFGVSPEMYQEDRNRQGLKDAIAMAQLDPMQYANAAIQAGAGRAAGGFAGLMGVEDPQMRLYSIRNALAKQNDISTPEGLVQYGQALQQAGVTQGALEAANLARKASSEVALAQQRAAEKMTPEQRNARAESELTDRLDQLTKFPQSPERDRAINVVKNQLTALTRGKPEKVSDAIQVAREVGVLTEALAKTQEGTPEYNSIKAQINRLEKSEKGQTTSALGKLLQERAALDPIKDKELYDIYTQNITKTSSPEGLTQALSSAFGVLGQALAPALKKEGEKTGEFSADTFNKLGSAVASGTSSLRNLSTLETALQNAFTGKFAEGKEGVVTSLSALGIPIGSDLKEAASNTQLIQAMGVRYVFPLVKNFPGSLAAKELDRLEKTAPNAIQQPDTIQRLVNLLRVDLAENKYTYDRAKEYKDKNTTTIGFREADQRIDFQTKLNNLQGLVATARRNKQMTKSQSEQIQQLKSELGL